MRPSRLDAIDGTRFGAVVIGGGIAGAGVARDLALRGVAVALFEKGDFGSGTTSRSSKLIHGGLRYLEQTGASPSRSAIETLVATYGRAYPRVLALATKVPEGDERLCPGNPEIVAQLHQAIDGELAVSLQDVLLRRTGIGTSRCQGRDCAEPIARRMAALLGWSHRRLLAELEAWETHVARSQRFRGARG